MPLLVLAEPRFTDADFRWIQDLRARHDERRYRMVGPHFTIVFPVPVSALEVRPKCAPFRVVLRSALVVKDSFQEAWDVFLVPDEGFGTLVRLHDALYAGLAEFWRQDIPYIPHVSIAHASEPAPCRELADRINATPPAIEGRVEELEIVSLESGQLRRVARVPLGV